MNMVAYCRVSTDTEDQLNSLQTQREFFEEYAKNINYTPPYELSECGAVHRLVIFDTTSEDGFERSLEQTLEILKDRN